MPITLNAPIEDREFICQCCHKPIDGIRPGLRILGNVYVIQQGINLAGLIGIDGKTNSIYNIHASCMIDVLLEVIQVEIKQVRKIRKTVKENMEED